MMCSLLTGKEFVNRRVIVLKNPNQAIENEKTKHTMNMKDTRVFGNKHTAD